MNFFLTGLLRMLLTCVGIFLLTFLVLVAIPGNPVFSRVDRGVNQSELEVLLAKERLSFSENFMIMLRKVLFFDFGRSMITGENIGQELLIRVKNTAVLAFCGGIIFIILGVGFGILGASCQGSILDSTLKLITTAFIATPVFWFGLMLIFIFSISFPILPATADGSALSLLLPALTVGLRPAAFLQRMLQNKLQQILAEPYITVAYAKGLSRFTVLFKHALRNALIPVLTITGMEIGALLTGAVVAETIFAWKGLGDYILFGIQTRDYHIILASVFISCIFVTFVNFVVELLCRMADPRNT
jgi:peptide/nickel transport system permease protein